jgi:GNAT superfamily N-acetyltransferase
MVQVLSATVFLLLLARLLRMPAGSWRFIVSGAVLVLASSQLLPVGTPLREDVRGSLGALFWIALAALPVLGYGLLIRAIRRRTDPARGDGTSARPQGLVMIPEDAALVRDTEAALARESQEPDTRISVAWRDDAGELAGHARTRIRGELAELELIWVEPSSRRQGIGSRLLDQSETEARLRGTTRILTTARTDEAARFLARRGFRSYASVAALRHLQKPLP